VSGTKPSRRTDLARRLTPALVAALAFALFTQVSRWLPSFALRADVIASVAIGLALLAALVVALMPLREFGHWLLVITAVALPLSAAFTHSGLLPAANVCKVVGAAALGFWLASQVTSLSVVVLIALIVIAIDIYSVFSGPTKAVLTRRPEWLGYLTIAFSWMGYAYSEAYSALGISDVIFYALFLGAAAAFGLRLRWTAVAMAASFLATVTAALYWRALPALPLLSLAFLGVNADLVYRRLWARGGSRPAGL
jgi:hypothetical protein